LLNSSFHAFVAEWRPITIGLTTTPIFLLAGASIWLLARHTRRLGAFTVLAQLLFVVLSLAAIRNAVWLGLGSMMLLAPALDTELRHRELANERINMIIAIGGVMFALIAGVAIGVRGAPAIAAEFPAKAGHAVARAAAQRPSAVVFADERFADWLMFRYPALVGRVAYDASFEQLSSKQVLKIIEWKDQIGEHWRAAAGGAGVIVLSLPTDKAVQHTYERDRTLQEPYVDSRIAVFVRK
jgi:hypothetical protein